MEYKITDVDLDWLEQKGHRVERVPETITDGRRYYHVDGIPRTEEQIVRYITEGHRMGE